MRRKHEKPRLTLVPNPSGPPLVDSVRHVLLAVEQLQRELPAWALADAPHRQGQNEMVFRINVQMLNGNLTVARQQLHELQTKSGGKS